MRRCANIDLLLVLTFIAVVLASCHEVRFRQSMEDVESMMKSNPQKALVKLDSMETSMKSASKSDRMFYALMRIKAHDYARDIPKSDSAACEIVKYYEKKHDNALLAEAYYYAGKTYMSLNDYTQATKSFLLTIKTLPDTTSELMGMTYHQLGNIYSKQRLDDDAQKMLRKSLCHAEMRNDTSEIIFCLMDLGCNYAEQERYDSALSYHEKTFCMAEEAHDDKMKAAVSALIANAYCRKGLYGKAYEFIQMPLRYNDPLDRIDVLTIASGIYTALNKQDSSTFFNEEIARIGDVYSKCVAYKDLAQHYSAVGDSKKSLEYTRLYAAYNDSVQKIRKAETIQIKSPMFDYNLREKASMEQKTEARRRNATIFILVGVIVALVVSAVAYSIYKKRRGAARLRMVDDMAKKNCRVDIDGDETNDKEFALFRSQIVQSILCMEHEPSTKFKLSDAKWRELQEVVNATYPNFDENLFKLCRISQRDYRICLLLKAQIKLSLISSIMNLSPSGLVSVRSRLYSKAFGIKGGAEAWDKVIRSL